MEAPADTREKLLLAATAVFLQHGFAAASMEQVRQAAGVSNGSLYHHFRTKSALADALHAHVLRDFHATLLAPIAGRASAQAGVRGMVRAYVAWVLAHPDGARLLHDIRRNADWVGGEWGQANAEGFAALRDWVARHTQAGALRPMPLATWTAIVFSPAISLTQHWVSRQPPAVPTNVRLALEHAAWMGVAAA